MESESLWNYDPYGRKVALADSRTNIRDLCPKRRTVRNSQDNKNTQNPLSLRPLLEKLRMIIAIQSQKGFYGRDFFYNE